VQYNLALLDQLKSWLPTSNTSAATIDVTSGEIVPVGESHVFETGMRDFSHEAFADLEKTIKAFQYPGVSGHTTHVHLDRVYILQDVIGIRVHIRLNVYTVC